ncbi:MAG: hypothetical protein AAF557_19135 [Pseudomonadota bacterium]
MKRPDGAPQCHGGEDCLVLDMWFRATEEQLEVGYDDEDDFVSIAELPSALQRLIDPELIVAKDREAVVIVDYPIDQPVSYAFKAASRRGFTKREIIQSISTIYQQIYAAKGNPYGIWGHVIEDLYFGIVHLYRANGHLWIVPIVGS